MCGATHYLKIRCATERHAVLEVMIDDAWHGVADHSYMKAVLGQRIYICIAVQLTSALQLQLRETIMRTAKAVTTSGDWYSREYLSDIRTAWC